MIDVITHDSKITELRIARAPINLIDVGVLKALRHALAAADASGQRGIILSGLPGVFSAGVDLVALLNSERNIVRAYWEQVFLLASEMALSRQPIIAAISGHCMAAGALLAVFCDYRVMARGDWNIGFNEVRVGVALPACFQFAIRRVVGALNAERLLVFGRMLDPEQALAINLVDELVAPINVVSHARERLQELVALPNLALTEARAIARRDLRDAFSDVAALPLDEFVDAFMQPETQAALYRVVAQMRARHTETTAS